MKKVYTGCSGWYYMGWNGVFYPENIKKSHWFRYYSGCFSTVEINSSFYRFPTEQRVKVWKKQAPESFVYAVKAPRLITHMKKFKGCSDLISDLYKTLSELGRKCGPVLFQLPPSIKFDPYFLTNMTGQLSREFKNAIEFRHTSWYCADTVKILEKSRDCMVTISAPGYAHIPEELFETTDFAYFRLHGITEWYRYDYTVGELEKIADVARNCHADTIYIYFNNDVNGNAPRNASFLKHLLQ